MCTYILGVEQEVKKLKVGKKNFEQCNWVFYSSFWSTYLLLFYYRTDDFLAELDDDFEPYTRDELEENEPLGPLKKPMISLYNLRSPAAIKSSFDSSTTIVNGTTTFACNGSANPPLGAIEKSASLSHVDNYPPSPGEHNHLSSGDGHFVTSSSRSYAWRLTPMRSCYLPNGVIPRQQSTTLDESGPLFVQGSSCDGSSMNGNSDKTLRVCENGVCLFC